MQYLFCEYAVASAEELRCWIFLSPAEQNTSWNGHWRLAISDRRRGHTTVLALAKVLVIAKLLFSDRCDSRTAASCIRRPLYTTVQMAHLEFNILFCVNGFCSFDFVPRFARAFAKHKSTIGLENAPKLGHTELCESNRNIFSFSCRTQ